MSFEIQSKRFFIQSVSLIFSTTLTLDSYPKHWLCSWIEAIEDILEQTCIHRLPYMYLFGAHVYNTRITIKNIHRR